MKNVAYYNGKIDLMENLTIPFNDRSHFFGDGIYDATIAANRKLFDNDFHMERFYNGLKLVGINFKMSPEELRAEIQKCVDLMDSDGPVFVYYSCTRGTASRSFTYPEGEPNLLINIRECKLADLRQHWKLLTVEDTRFYHCNIKTLNLLPAVMASEKAKQAGCQEVIFHRGERVTECAHNNINIIKDGKFITPPLDELILPGTMRRHILEVCRRLDIPYEERPFTLDELMNADEVVVTCTSTMGVPASHVDGKPVGGRAPEILRKIQEALIQDFYEQTGFMPDVL